MSYTITTICNITEDSPRVLCPVALTEEHQDIVKWVLQILADNKLSLYPKKCKFYQIKVEYLGVILLQDSIEADPTKIKEVADWPEPYNRREVWQFLGFCNFYWRFIPGFAKVAKPLIELTEKKK